MLGFADVGSISLESELLTQRTLDAVAPHYLAFSFRGFYRFLADNLDFEHVTVILADMLECAQELAGFDEKLGLEGL